MAYSTTVEHVCTMFRNSTGMNRENSIIFLGWEGGALVVEDLVDIHTVRCFEVRNFLK